MTEEKRSLSMYANLRSMAIIVGYVLVFWGVLPGFLWWFGQSCNRWFSLPAISTPALHGLGAVVAVMGVVILFWSILLLWSRGRGLPISHLPPIKLVQRGPYAWFKHPIYVGYNLAFCGVGLWMGSLGHAVFASALLWGGWVAYAHFLEEPALRRRFGDQYNEYTHGNQSSTE